MLKHNLLDMHVGPPEDTYLQEAIALSLKRDSHLAESLEQDIENLQSSDQPEVGLGTSS